MKTDLIRLYTKGTVSMNSKICFCTITCLILAIMSSRALDLPDYKDHPCIRECEVNKVMTCEYNFTLEYYYTLSRACYDCPYNQSDCQRPHCVPGGGASRPVIVVNRLLPGPAIHVCKDDIIKVNVHNKMESGEGTTIHWHGIHQRDHQHMDGTPMVTQCPIPSDTSFQYRFPAAIPGTHYWHSHVGHQRGDGVFGALVVRKAQEQEEHVGIYDYDLPEHTILLIDWITRLNVQSFVRSLHVTYDGLPETILINGKGAYKEFDNDNTNKTIFTPYEVFKVTQGRRYRFRVISNVAFNCPIQISIDNHTLSVIASDGNSFQKVEVDSFYIMAGERYDFVLNADHEVGNYWLRAKGNALCVPLEAHQLAIIHYDGAKEADPVLPVGFMFGNRDGKKLNPFNERKNENLLQVTDLQSLNPNNDILNKPPNKKFYLAVDNNFINNERMHDPVYYPIRTSATKRTSPQINHISYVNPPAPMLTQFQDIPQNILCNEETIERNCSEEYCECVHVVKLQIDDIVELVLIGEGQGNPYTHPMHLHGYSFWVVGMGKLNDSTTREEVMDLDSRDRLDRNLNNTLAKDSVILMNGGYVILRFYANNPGFWLFHCHLQLHNQLGMGLVFQVGEINQMPRSLKHFPRCGPWHFTGYEEPVNNNVQDTGNNERPCLNLYIITAIFIAMLKY